MDVFRYSFLINMVTLCLEKKEVVQRNGPRGNNSLQQTYNSQPLWEVMEAFLLIEVK